MVHSLKSSRWERQKEKLVHGGSLLVFVPWLLTQEIGMKTKGNVGGCLQPAIKSLWFTIPVSYLTGAGRRAERASHIPSLTPMAFCARLPRGSIFPQAESNVLTSAD